MHRFYIPPAQWNPDAPVLDEAEAHHASHVLRLREGSRVVIFNGEGSEATTEIESISKHSVTLKKTRAARTPKLACRITLAQAIPKGKTMDLIVQKATELGVTEIVPLLSERTVVQVDDEDAGRKAEKWQHTAIEAAKQCGQNWLPIVRKPVTPRQYFDSKPRQELQLIGSLQPDSKPFHNVLQEAKAAGQVKSALILIGPEGDFTPAESAMAKSYGCRGISLGPIVLRTETASIYCLSVLGYELF